MVNTGQPSRSCKDCLTRRLKCDGLKPSCRKCIKAKRVCAYRDLFESKLRDETQLTILRASGHGRSRSSDKSASEEEEKADYSKPNMSPSKRKRSTPSPSKPGLNCVVDGDTTKVVGWPSGTTPVVIQTRRSQTSCTRQQIDSILLHSPQYSPQEQAKCFFLSNFVLSPSGRQHPAQPQFMAKFAEPRSTNASAGNAAFASFKATSMAALAGKTRSKDLMVEAHACYTTALSQLKLLLQSSPGQRSNEALASILMLAMFEVCDTARTNPTAIYLVGVGKANVPVLGLCRERRSYERMATPSKWRQSPYQITGV